MARLPLDWPYAYHAVRYVLRNPVCAGMARLPWGYGWSSAAFQVGETKTDPLVKKDERLEKMVGDWRKYLCETEEDEELRALRRATSVGRPVGNRGFLRQLEARLDRHLVRRWPGRPPKERNR